MKAASCIIYSLLHDLLRMFPYIFYPVFFQPVNSAGDFREPHLVWEGFAGVSEAPAAMRDHPCGVL